MIGFAYSLIPVGFRAILTSFLSFLNQKTYPGEYLRPGVILSRSYLRKCCICLSLPPIIINLSFVNNAINSELLGVGGQYFQDFHVSMILTTGKKKKKIHGVRVTCRGWFNMEVPNEASLPLSNHCYDHCNNVFYPFS